MIYCNKLINELISLNIIDKNSIIDYYPSVRDRDDVKVLKCKKSGLIFLNQTHQINEDYYKKIEIKNYWNAINRKTSLETTFRDDFRRRIQIEKFVLNKDYADIGSGLGGILDLVKPLVKSIVCVEPQNEIRNQLKNLGYETYESVQTLNDSNKKFDFVTLFHVFEHFVDPLNCLKILNNIIKPTGKIFIEVPNANDVLISKYELESFKKFTFWSEHLILHTKDSLKKYLKSAGFKNIKIKGHQRYPLSNHIEWLKTGNPGGQNIHTFLNDFELNKVYEKVLDKENATDTLIAIAEK